MTLDPKFIEMFAKAKCQEEWQPHAGDVFATKLKGKWVKGRVSCDCCNQRRDMDNVPNEYMEWRKGRSIFLPTTDQLAEMWEEKRRVPAWEFLGGLRYFARDECWEKDYPLQVIALCFVQFDLYGLTWDSERKEWK